MSRILRTIPLLIAVCLVSIPAQAQYGGGSGTTASAETNTYVFLLSQSTVVQTGGIAGVHWTYSVEGLFQLTVAPDAGSASFAHVDANATDDSPLRRSLDPNEVFNMTSLLGAVLDDTTISFTGKAADGSDVLITVTIEDDLAYLVGETIPPPNTADFFLFSLDAVAQRKYGGGTGEPNDPYLIYTAEHLNAIGADANDWDKHFTLMADIDLSGFTGTNFNIIGYGVSWSDNEPFTGVFDGNGHKISNFNYSSTDTNFIGLFGYVGTGGKDTVIKDLGLIDPNIDAGTGNYVGSLAGRLLYGTITGCYAEGASVSGNDMVGGLVGALNWEATITNCYSTGSVSGDSNVGGLAGSNGGTITNCYSTGSVSGASEVGGLVGQNGLPSLFDYAFGTITNCYSVGAVTGTTDVGGLVGLDDGGEVYSSFWDIETSGQATSAGGTGKTIAEMQMASTFFGWWSGSVWTIDEKEDYPRLVWENMPGQIITNPYGGGSGTQANPYLIYKAEQLNIIGLVPSDWDKHFKLMADIDLSGFTGTDFNIIGIDRDNAFTGVFDGNGHTISNFTYSSTDRESWVGLFRYVSWGGEIKDLGLIDANVDAGTGNYVGSLVGYMYGGTINNCYAEGASVSGGNSVGGLFGRLQVGIITNCYSTGSVAGDEDVGGLVGFNSRGTITNSYSIGSVSGTADVGGLVGSSNWGVAITNCYATGSVDGDEDVGGLVGENYGDSTITNSYSTGSVTGNRNVGGLVGYNDRWSEPSTITNCYSTGSVSGEWGVGGLVGCNFNDGTITDCTSSASVSGTTDVGGLVGGNYGAITNCYSVGSVTGTTDVGGLVGANDGGTVTESFWDIQTSGQETSAGGTGKTTAEMQMESTFTDVGWDFVAETANGTEDIWSICEGTNYPVFFWQIPVGDFLCPDGVNFIDFAFFADHWRDDNCDLSNDYCDGTDLDFSGTVDEADLEILVENWLAGVRSD